LGKAFTETEKEQVRAGILKAAYGLFETLPYGEVKIEAIAKAAGIGKGTLYLFFTSKEHVFIEVMMTFEERLQSRIRLTIESLVTAEEKLLKAITIGLRETDNNEIYKALMDGHLMGRIMATLSEEQMAQMAQLDLDFMDNIIGDLPIKVSRELAVDLLRGVFYLRLYEAQLLSPKEQFYDAYLRGVIHHIL